MIYTPTHLRRWTSEDPAVGGAHNYMGTDFSEYYVLMLQTRDSDHLEQSNFATAEALLEAIPDPVDWPHEDAPSWISTRTNHWAVGWCDWLMIHEDAEAHLREGDRIRGKLEDYPVLDDDDYSQREYDDIVETWGAMSLRDRAKYLGEGESIFAIRREAFDFPAKDGDWPYCLIRP